MVAPFFSTIWMLFTTNHSSSWGDNIWSFCNLSFYPCAGHNKDQVSHRWCFA